MDDLVGEMLSRELVQIPDEARKGALRSVMVEPRLEHRSWDYGPPGDRHACWVVARSPNLGTVIVYCRSGFGPSDPWGVLPADSGHLGADGQWFKTLDDAFLCSAICPDPKPPGFVVE